MLTKTPQTQLPNTVEAIGRDRLWIGIGALLALISVAAGAAGTHALEDVIDADALDTFETAVRFQMYHALALLFTGLLSSRWTSWASWVKRLVNAAGWLFTFGTVIFSGSLYILALTDIGLFGAIAPIGGACLLAGWASLALGVIRR